jgi:hypothetical protein
MRLQTVLILMAAFAIVAGCSVLLAGCSSAAVGSTLSSTGPTSSVVQAEAGTATTARVTTTSEAATTTSAAERTTTSSTVAALDTTTTIGAVQVTNESGTSYCLIKDLFTRDGKNYLVVDYVTLVPTGSGEANDLYVQNQNPLLRTFVIPAGADLHAFEILRALLGESALTKRLDENNEDTSITIDELKQAIAKGIVNSRAGYRCWSLTVSKGRVVVLTNDFG